MIVSDFSDLKNSIFFQAEAKPSSLKEKISTILSRSLGKQVTLTSDLKNGAKIEGAHLSSFLQLICCLIDHKMQEGKTADEALEEIVSPLLELPDREACELKLKEIVEKKHWKDPFLETSNYAQYAVAGVLDGRLNVNQASMVLFYWSLRKYHAAEEIEVIDLFNTTGEVHERARAIILQTLKPVVSSLYYQSVESSQIPSSFLNSHELEAFFETLRKDNPSQQQFFVIKDLQRDLDTFSTTTETVHGILNDQRTISGEINKSTGINVFCRFEEEGQKKRMIASLGMMQTYLNIKAGPDAATLFPVIGASPVEMFVQGGKWGFRVFALPSPLFQLPTCADELQAPQDYDFFYHDFYHAILMSCIPVHLRPSFIFLAELVKQIRFQKTFSQSAIQFLETWSEIILDLEYVYFREESAKVRASFSEGVIFWQSIAESARMAHLRCVLKKMRQEKIKDVSRVKEFFLASAQALQKEDIWAFAAEEMFKIRKELKKLSQVSMRQISEITPPIKNAISQQITQLYQPFWDLLPEQEKTKMIQKKMQVAYRSNLLIQLEEHYLNRNEKKG